MKGFWNELQRRQIVKSAVAYLVVSWLIIQVLSILFPTFSFSPDALRWVIIFLAVLFPAWIIFNWIYEPSSQGLVKTDDTPDDSEGIEKKRISLNRVIIVGLSLAVVLLIVNTFRLQSKIIRDDDGKSSIAVLYFDNMSADEDNAWISDGMTESISTKLEHNKNLLVIGRTSVKQFRDSDEPITEIAKKLNVSYILEGSVRIHNNKALITAQLIDKNDVHVWSREFNVVLDDILGTQSMIAGQIVDELRIALSPEEKKQLEYQITNNLEAYKLYQKGRAFAEVRTEENLRKSIFFYEKAVEMDSTFAEAYAELGYSHYLLGHGGFVLDSLSLFMSTQYMEKAFVIDSNTVRALTLKAGILATYEGKYEKAETFLKRAIEINPNDALAHYLYSSYFIFGADPQPDKAFEQIKIALRLEPMSAIFNNTYVLVLATNNQFTEAENYLNNLNNLLTKDQVIFCKNFILEKKANYLSKQAKDYTLSIKIFEDALLERPNDPQLNILLADAYKFILNDNANYLEYGKHAFEIDSTFLSANCFINGLIENEKFEEALSFMRSDDFNKFFNNLYRSFTWWNFYYSKGDYLKAQEVAKDSTLINSDYHNLVRLFNLARLGQKKEIQQIFEDGKISSTYKAIVYALLKNRDSMYYYLNQDDIDFKFINGCRAIDPYRKEERYKAFLKKNYLPLTHWNE